MAVARLLGFIHARGGSHDEALTHHRHAVELYRAAGEARALVGLGDLHYHAGRRAESAADFQRGLDLAQAVGDRWGAALAAIGLGFTAAPATPAGTSSTAWPTPARRGTAGPKAWP